jgi:hypothetical protein
MLSLLSSKFVLIFHFSFLILCVQAIAVAKYRRKEDTYLDKQKILQLVRCLDERFVESYGYLVTYSDLYNAYERMYGIDNSDIFNYLLESLENEGLIEIQRLSDFDNDLFVGVRAK